MQHTRCRICDRALPEPFLNLGVTPLANSFLSSPDDFPRERFYPLAVTNCPACGLVQLTYVVAPQELYRNYIYTSSTSDAVRAYAVQLASHWTNKLQLNETHQVVELGSNDGTVLKAFRNHGVRVLGVEPARNIAKIAVGEGIPTVNEFFNTRTALSISKEYGKASVILGRHVFAHLNDFHNFFKGVQHLLHPEGYLLIEVPYLGDLVEKLEFDTIYHEHLSYIALKPVEKLCQMHGFSLIDAERVSLHGGSILLTIRRGESLRHTERLDAMISNEEKGKLCERKELERFAAKIFRWKSAFESFINRLGEEKKTLIGYGAAAKANTLLNFVPRQATALKYILDKSPHKQGLYAPGTHLPVVPVERWREEKNGTYMLILAWNFQEEIRQQLKDFSEEGGRFVIPIPEPALLSS